MFERKNSKQGGKYGTENPGAELNLHEPEGGPQIDKGVYYMINHNNTSFLLSFFVTNN